MNDHMPECGRCGDLNEPGAERCVCGAPLYMPGRTPPRRLAVVAALNTDPVVPYEKWWRERFTQGEINQIGGWAA